MFMFLYDMEARLTYQLILTRQAEKFLDRLLVGDRAAAQEIRGAIRNLREDPRPLGYRKLEGVDSSYRIKVKNYRVLYRIDKGQIIVEIFKIGHRREVYKNLK